MKPIIIISAAVISMLLTSCSGTAGKEVTGDSAIVSGTVSLTDLQLKNASVEMGVFSEQAISETIHLNGMIDVPPQNIVSVSFPMGGYLRSTKLLPGMRVSKGESIAVLEDQSLVQLQQDYLMARTKLQLLKLEYERQRSLNETKTSADKVLQQAQADYESTRVLVMGLGEKLRLIHINPDKLTSESISGSISIHSPINGFVSKVNVNIGKYVQPQDVLFELINPSDVHAALTVFEKDLNKIKEGQKMSVSFVDEPEKFYPAEVILVTRNVDENRSGIVHCHFEKTPGNLRPGMFISAVINLSVNNVWALPEGAVVRYDQKEFLFMQKGKNLFEAIPVKTGRRNKGWVEIVLPGDSLLNKPLVIKNAFAVLSKMKNVSDE